MGKAAKPNPPLEPFELPSDREQSGQETTPCIYCRAPVVHWPFDVPLCDACDKQVAEGADALRLKYLTNDGGVL